jgi:hypothetical protein
MALASSFTIGAGSLALQGKSVKETAKTLLNALQAAGAEAVDYMPAQLIDLPMHLQDCAFRVLLHRPWYEKDRPFEVTEDDLDDYSLSMSREDQFLEGRRQLKNTAEYIAEARELAERLGLHFKGITP